MRNRIRLDSNEGQLLVTSLTVAFGVATQTMLMLLSPLYAISLGAGAGQVGLLISLTYVLPLLLALPIGSLVDRLGSKGPIIAACAALALAPALVWAIPGLVTLAVVQALAGVAQLTLVVASQRHVSELGRGAKSERNFGWYTTFQSAGQLAGPLLGGVLVDTLAQPLPFLITGALAAVAVVIAQGLRNLEPIGSTPSKRVGARNEVRAMLNNYGVRMGIAISCGVLLALAARQSMLPVYLEELDFAATTIGLLISFRALVSMLVRPFMPAILARFGGRATTAFLMVVMLAVGLGMNSFATTIIPLLISAALIGIGSGITQPLSMVTITDYVQRDRVGFALGLRLTANRLAQSLSPALIGVVAERAGIPWAFAVAAGTLLITAGLIWYWKAPFEKAELALQQAHSSD